MDNIRIFALGGLDENGKNCYCIEVDDQLFVVNCGLKKPDDAQYGVECIIPDFSYIIENKKNLCGVIITHLHDDMMDALPYLLKECPTDIYAPRICTIFINRMLIKNKIYGIKVHELPRYGEVKIKGRKLTTFGLSHSTPEAIGIALETSKGSIVVAEQFVVDFDMHESIYNCDIGALAEIGKKGVLCALMEASYADHRGFTAPRHRISHVIRPMFEDAKGRIIVSCYNQNYFRIREVMALAREFKKRIYVYDDEFRDTLQIFAENGYYKIPAKMELTKKEFNNDLDDVVILVTGNGAQTFKAMHKIAINEDPTIELRETDTVIIASPIVPGTTKIAVSMENELYKDNVTIHKLNSKEILSMHPSNEDLKLFLYLLKPTYFLPVMGDYCNFNKAANIALEAGFTPDKIMILDNGQIATFVDGRLKNCSNFVDKHGEQMIGSKDNKDITSFVLKDRELLSTDGVIVLGIAVNYNTKEIIGGPDIQSRGVIYVKDSEYLIKNIGKIVVETIQRNVSEGNYDNMATRAELRESISRYVLRETGKRPMILPAIIEIILP